MRQNVGVSPKIHARAKLAALKSKEPLSDWVTDAITRKLAEIRSVARLRRTLASK